MSRIAGRFQQLARQGRKALIPYVVAGDPGRNQSRGYMSNHIQAPRTSRRIDLPARWPQIMADVAGISRAGRR